MPKPQMIRVEPANDDMRKYLKHPRGGGFRTGATEWPLDRFTRRRLADGSVKQAETHAQQGKHAVEPHARPNQRPPQQRTEPTEPTS